MGKVISLPVGDSLLRELFSKKMHKRLDEVADDLLRKIDEAKKCPIEKILIQDLEMFYTNQRRYTIVLPSGTAVFIRKEKDQICFYLSRGAGRFDSSLYNKIIEGNATSPKKNREFLYHKGGLRKLICDADDNVFQTCWIGPMNQDQLIALANQT